MHLAVGLAFGATGKRWSAPRCSGAQTDVITCLQKRKGSLFLQPVSDRCPCRGLSQVQPPVSPRLCKAAQASVCPRAQHVGDHGQVPWTWPRGGARRALLSGEASGTCWIGYRTH